MRLTTIAALAALCACSSGGGSDAAPATETLFGTWDREAFSWEGGIRSEPPIEATPVLGIVGDEASPDFRTLFGAPTMTLREALEFFTGQAVGRAQSMVDGDRAVFTATKPNGNQMAQVIYGLAGPNLMRAQGWVYYGSLSGQRWTAFYSRSPNERL